MSESLQHFIAVTTIKGDSEQAQDLLSFINEREEITLFCSDPFIFAIGCESMEELVAELSELQIKFLVAEMKDIQTVGSEFGDSNDATADDDEGEREKSLEDSVFITTCSNCGEKIECPSLRMNEVAPCPYCGKDTKLVFNDFKMWQYQAVCPNCHSVFKFESSEKKEMVACGDCGVEVPLREGSLPSNLPMRAADPAKALTSPCPRCRQPVPKAQNVCPHCGTSLIPVECPNCGCREFHEVTPAKPMVFAPLSFTGILASAGASVAADAIFGKSYYCVKCGHKSG